MSCQACTRSYGFFCKEGGCANCGYSFCTKCLRKEIEIPKYPGQKVKVCPKCFEKLEAIAKSEELLPGVERFTLPLGSTSSRMPIFDLDDPTVDGLGPILQPVQPCEEVVTEGNDEDDEISKNLDCIISKKLKNLKEGNKGLPTESEIAARLAELKGIPNKNYNNSDILLSNDKRTDEEKIDNLLRQFVDESAIDQHVDVLVDPVTDIEQRLAALRGSEFKYQIPNDTTPSDNENNEIDDDVAATRIVNRFLEEVRLPEVDPNEQELMEGLPKPTEATEELPWCTICNEDAILRCRGCEGELFCRSCFKEVHNDEEYRAHKTETYSTPPNLHENHF